MDYMDYTDPIDCVDLDYGLTTGVYGIFNKLNGKVYVGSASISLAGRLRSHREGLRNETHFNVLLQRASNKYGAKAFSFRVIDLTRAKMSESAKKRYRRGTNASDYQED